jgi:two-component sensor histidine kinase
MASLLSLALLPVGLIAVVQTQSVTNQGKRNAEMALLALTEQAASSERLALKQARGVVEGLQYVLPDMLGDPEQCSATLRALVDGSDRFSFVGFIPVSGFMTCSSSDRQMDANRFEIFAEMVANPRLRITATSDGEISNTSVVVSQPVFTGASLAGFITISIPHAAMLEASPARLAELRQVVTFNADGDILSIMFPAASGTSVSYLPATLNLLDLVGQSGRAFRTTDPSGRELIYTHTPIAEESLYVIAAWYTSTSLFFRTGSGLLNIAFPVMMWIVSLAVALFAVHRLITRHLRVLSRRMNLFAASRHLPAEGLEENAPSEIKVIQLAFRDMADSILHDEAALEDTVREKVVLVKEIHHRVKNNLQLISSMINMQIRTVKTAEAKNALRRIQDRVLSMATIHQDLYRTNAKGLVNASHLVREVMEKSVALDVAGEKFDLELRIDDIWLFPDQAVPLSLLAAEATVNALKHTANLPAKDRWIKAEFRIGDGMALHFSISNAIGPAQPDDQPPQTGMGNRLIRAFATQLAADIDVIETLDSYSVHVNFQAAEFAP